MREQDERDLLGAWALDALDGPERDAVERAMARDPELAAEGRALQEVAALLAADSAAPPPGAVRARTLDAIARTPQERPAPGAAEGGPASAPAGSGGPSRAPARDAGPAATTAQGRGSAKGGSADVVPLGAYRARRRERWLAAAAVLVAAAVPSVLAIEQGRRADEAEEQVAIVAEALAEPGATLVSEDVAGGGRAVAVVGAEAAVFAADGLGELAADEVYQLWVIDDGGPESAGVLVVADGRVSAEVEDLPAGAVLAMTVEPAGGSTQPTSDPVVAISAGG
ncbi:anti-sigma factor [Georgenia wangjunii]|uniref:anti-sigma factor n=1 Tax=Georgenia wangjunii TaxID=3117730 RepID=UPI002F26D10A